MSLLKGRVTRGPIAGQTIIASQPRWFYSSVVTWWPDGFQAGPEIRIDHGWYVWVPADRVWVWEPLDDRQPTSEGAAT